MFEKEAEEFEKRKHYRYEDNDYCGDIADGIIQAYQQGAEFGYNKANEWHKQEVKVIQELKKENAELKEQVENRNCSNCRRSKAGCPNDDSCHNFSLWQPFINPQLIKAK